MIDTAYYIDPTCTEADLRWLGYVLEAAQLDQLSQDVGVPGLSRETAYTTPVPVLSLDQQRLIASFLDGEVAQLETLVRLKKALASAFAERLHAAVQRMIVSLPRNGKLGYSGTWLSGGTPPKEEEQYWAGSVPWASTKDLVLDELHDTMDHITEEAAQLFSRIVPPGALLIATRGMALAKRLPLATARLPLAFNQDLKAVVPASGIQADYLRIAVRGYQSELLAAVVEAAHGTRRLETRHLKALRIPVPSLDTQRRIVEDTKHLERKNSAILRALHQQMHLLQERRVALVAAAVTGQLDPASYPISEIAA